MLEKNILGKEPEWLTLKRENDKEKPIDEFKLKKIIKQQLINEKKYFLEQNNEKAKESGIQLVKK